jgi:hypothetical protein
VDSLGKTPIPTAGTETVENPSHSYEMATNVEESTASRPLHEEENVMRSALAIDLTGIRV